MEVKRSIMPARSLFFPRTWLWLKIVLDPWQSRSFAGRAASSESDPPNAPRSVLMASSRMVAMGGIAQFTSTEAEKELRARTSRSNGAAPRSRTALLGEGLTSGNGYKVGLLNDL